jgi:hypothetical protein
MIGRTGQPFGGEQGHGDVSACRYQDDQCHNSLGNPLHAASIRHVILLD